MGRVKRSHVLFCAATAVVVCLAVSSRAQADNEFFPPTGAVDDQALAQIAGTPEDDSDEPTGRHVTDRATTDGSINATFYDPSSGLVQSEPPPLSAGALAILQDLGISVPQ